MDIEPIRTPEELATLLRLPKKICHRLMYHEPLRAAMEYMIAHVNEPVCLGAVALAVNMERTSLCRCFRRKIKIGPCDVANRLKVAKASETLLKSDRSVALIATDFGYGSVSTFVRNFKRLTGCTPSSYRTSFFTEGEDANTMAVNE